MCEECKNRKNGIFTKRNLKNFDEQLFCEDVAYVFANLAENNSDVQVALHSFANTSNTLISIVDKHAPLKRLRIKERIAPWFNKELSALLCERDKAWSRARHSGDPSHWLHLRQLRNKCTSALRKSKSNYYLNLITSSSSNPTMFWKAVNMDKNRNKKSKIPLLSNTMGNQVAPNDSETCHILNKHFAEAATLFDKEYPELHLDNSDSGSCTANNNIKSSKGHISSFSFHPFTCSEVFDALQTINPKCSTGEDNLDSFFLKLAAPIITQQLTDIFNLSISSGKFPIQWKSAHVVPLH